MGKFSTRSKSVAMVTIAMALSAVLLKCRRIINGSSPSIFKRQDKGQRIRKQSRIDK
ncbi:MAG: hypothetical protein R2685_09860 [Candidatus Nitrosocosmicus sp.]|nr:hypothetical protein [Candidatus Nitrosocosmicus sp.]